MALASSSTRGITITPVRTPEDLTAIIALFSAYANSLNLDLSFQDFQTEMASMPGKYSPSAGGELLIARLSTPRLATAAAAVESSSHSASPEFGEAIGCVAVRPLTLSTSSPAAVRICEMKRLYVSPTARGLGLGRALAKRVIGTAKDLGYNEMRLDTLPSMQAAQAMYLDLGFEDIDPYCFNPVDGTRFLGLKLQTL